MESIAYNFGLSECIRVKQTTKILARLQRLHGPSVLAGRAI